MPKESMPSPKKKLAEYNPFKDSLTAAAKRAEQQQGILDSITEELADEPEKTLPLGTMPSRSAMMDQPEKTMRNPAFEGARKPVDEDDEIIEGELLEEGAPTMEGFQSGAEVVQEQLRAVQAKAEGADLGLDTIDPANPASVKEGAKHVLDSFLGTPDQQKILEEQMGLTTGKIALERKRLESLITGKVKTAAHAFRSNKIPMQNIVEELRSEINKFLRKL